MRISLSQHLKLRIKVRKINRQMPKRIVEESKELYFDQETKHFIAVKEETYAKKKRPMVAIFDKSDDSIEIITVYPTDKEEIAARIMKGRWVYEKDKN